MAPATPPVAPSVLLRLLEAAGYRLEEGDDMTWAVRASDHRTVVLASRARAPAEIERRLPPGAVHRTIVYDEEPGPSVRGAAAELGLEVLEPSTLGPALGELLLPSALVPGVDAAPDDAFDGPFPPIGGGPRTVRPRIDRREAQALAGLDGARYTLRLVPYLVAAYRVRPVSPSGAPGAVVRRLIAVNAVTRQAEVWEEGSRELVGELEGPSERLAPQLNAVGATPIALEAIRRQHTVRLDHIEQHSGALVVESRRVPPSLDAVRLGPFNLLFVPFWYAESTDGRRVLDAVSGRGAAFAEPDPG